MGPLINGIATEDKNKGLYTHTYRGRRIKINFRWPSANANRKPSRLQIKSRYF